MAGTEAHHRGTEARARLRCGHAAAGSAARLDHGRGRADALSAGINWASCARRLRTWQNRGRCVFKLRIEFRYAHDVCLKVFNAVHVMQVLSPERLCWVTFESLFVFEDALFRFPVQVNMEVWYIGAYTSSAPFQQHRKPVSKMVSDGDVIRHITNDAISSREFGLIILAYGIAKVPPTRSAI